MAKSAQAFRTIREVADWLDVAAHVLRFWESKFPQIKPVKRAGGRRYYRPADMELVGGIKVLLHDRGLTIRGVQKMIADEGTEAVSALSPPIDGLLDNPNVVQLNPADAWDVDADAEAAFDADEDDAALLEDEMADLAPAMQELAEEHTREPEDAATPDLPDAEEAAEPEAALPKVEPEPPLVAAQTMPQASPPHAAPPHATPTPPEPTPPRAEIKAAPRALNTLPHANPAEGRLGALAAIAALPAGQRAALAPQIAALARLRNRMAADPRIR